MAWAAGERERAGGWEPVDGEPQQPPWPWAAPWLALRACALQAHWAAVARDAAPEAVRAAEAALRSECTRQAAMLNPAAAPQQQDISSSGGGSKKVVVGKKKKKRLIRDER
jgi:hypothetical protein